MRDTNPTWARRLCAVAIAIMAVCLMLVNAGAASAESSSPPVSSEKVVFRVGGMENADSLNPFIGYSGLDYLIYHLNYDFLVGWDPVKLEPRPEFAESWSNSADGKTWTFKIRPGMTWQDGQPATARDVAFTFNYILENDLWAYTLYLNYIKKVTALDDATVVFECRKPKADILHMSVPILPEHIWSKVSGKAAGRSFVNGPPTIGSGPFKVFENKQNLYVRLVANPDYWRGKPAIDELLFETYQNADTMVQDLESGALDAVVGVPAAQFKALASESITANACVSWSFEQLTFNCYDNPDSKGNPVLLDQQFRQALQYAVDREKNAAVAYSGYMDPGGTLLPQYSPYRWEPPSDQAYTYDPEKAKAMLDAAGYKDVNGDGFRETKQGKPLELRLYTDSQTPENVTTSKLTVGWLKDVGVEAHLEAIDPGTLSAALSNWEGDSFAPDFDTDIWWWMGGAEPTFILSLLTPEQIAGWSDTSWTDPEYTALFNQQSATIDLEARIALVQQMQQIAYESSPYLIFGYFQFLEAYNTAEWEGYVRAPSGYSGYNGDALYYPDVIDTYVSLQPKAAGATETSGSRSWIFIVVIVVVVGAAVAVWLLRRGRGKAVEEG